MIVKDQSPERRVITRMSLLPLSAIYIENPVGSNETKRGLLNFALVPTPSADPQFVDPASVDTCPIIKIM